MVDAVRPYVAHQCVMMFDLPGVVLALANGWPIQPGRERIVAGLFEQAGHKHLPAW